MNTDLIQTPHYRSIIENTFEADKNLDAAKFASKLTENGTFQLGPMHPIVGRAAIQAMLEETFKNFRSVSHELRSVYELESALVFEGTVTYTYADGTQVLGDYANVLKFEGELASSYRVYIDLGAMAPS